MVFMEIQMLDCQYATRAGVCPGALGLVNVVRV